MRKRLLISIVIAIFGLSISLFGAYREPQEEEAGLGPRLYNQAVAAYEQERYEDAYKLFFEAGIHTDDAELAALITFNMATFLWQAQAAEAGEIVALYQESLRMNPTEEASFNLELLYDLLREAQEGDQRQDGGNKEGRNTYGDI